MQSAYHSRGPDYRIGNRFGRLVVLEPAPDDTRVYGQRKLYAVKCKCDCGRESIHMLHSLKAGRIVSCGCYALERAREVCVARSTKHGGARRAGNRATEFEIWQGIKKRCTNPRSTRWAYYGGRGIKICDRWMNSYETFLADVGPRPSARHTIDRIDNDGHYEPENVRWATMKEQCNNRRPRSR